MQLTTSLLALLATGVLAVPSGLDLRTDPYCPPPPACPSPYCPAPPPVPTPYCPAPPPCPTPYCPSPTPPPPPPPCPTPYCPAPTQPPPPPPCPTPYCPPPKWTPPPKCTGGYNYCKTSAGKYSKDMNNCAPTGGDACCCKPKGLLDLTCISIISGDSFDLGLTDILS